MDKRISENKALLAAYLNMAQQNAENTLRHISQLMGIQEVPQNLYDYQFLKELKTAKEAADEGTGRVKSERLQKIMALLHRHFPFLKAFLESEYRERNRESGKDKNKPKCPVSPAAYRKAVCDVLRLLGDLRNEYTHYDPQPRSKGEQSSHEKLQKTVVGYLYLCLLGGTRVVGARFKDTFKPQDYTFLTGTPRYKYVKTPDGKKKPEEREDFFYRLKDGNGLLSYVGVLLFASLFLHKKYVAEMLAQSGLFVPGERKMNTGVVDMERRILTEVFSIYRIRLSKERMESTRPDYALGLDMLNELQKCPPELYDVLAPEGQAVFRVKRDYDDEGQQADNGEVLLKRFDDRFPYFALRYLDESHAFDAIRFQVSVGRYRYKFYPKACIDVVRKHDAEDGSEADRLRSLQKDVNGFGRLGEVEAERLRRYAGHIFVEKPQDDDTPYITDHRASYVFNGNRIGLLFNWEGGRNDLQEVPEADGATLYLPALTFNGNDLGKDVRCVPPAAWLSTYELPAVLFHHLLCRRYYGATCHLTEDILMDCVKLYHQLFADVRSGRWKPGVARKDPEAFLAENYHTDQVCLHAKDIPQKLMEYLLQKGMGRPMKELFKKRSRERMERMLEGTRVRLKKFQEELAMQGSSDNKFGKKRYVDIRPGRLAAYLAKDMLFFQPYDDAEPNKLTGLNYQVLQGALAVYDRTPDEFRQLFQNARLLVPGNGEREHPFLGKVLQQKPNTAYQFYSDYLKAKIVYLEERLADKNETFATLFRLDHRQKWQPHDKAWYADLAGRYLDDVPVELPRGLFLEPIKHLLGRLLADGGQLDGKPGSKKMRQALNTERCNMAWLIAQYFNQILRDGNQPFYDSERKLYRRTYKYFNILNNQKEGNKLVQLFQSTAQIEDFRANQEEVAKKAYLTSREARALQNPEARLRKHLSAYKKNETAIRHYRVQDMLLFLMAKALLLEKGGLKEQGKLDGYRLRDVAPAADSILSLELPFSITVKLADGTERIISQEAIKAKNCGDFFRFLYDARVATLLPYTEAGQPLDRTLIEKELENYDLQRVPVFRLVHHMEQLVLRLCPELNDPSSPDYFFETDKVDKDGKPKTLAVKTNFREMLGKLKTKEGLRPDGLENLREDELELMVEVRNSFGHNRYARLALKGKVLPNIAKTIYGKFDGVVGRTVSLGRNQGVVVKNRKRNKKNAGKKKE